jgi:hypothetical protein
MNEPPPGTIPRRFSKLDCLEPADTLRMGARSLRSSIGLPSKSTPPNFQRRNTLIAFTMGISAETAGFGDAYMSANYFNTLYFPKDGPVFDLSGGYSADIYGLNVVNNRVVLPQEPGGEVPEPSTYGMVAAGLALAGFLKRRREAFPK